MKIGFIAMSGVRAHNEALTELGLTLPGFVERNKVIASLPSLSLLTLAGLTPEHYEIDYREIVDFEDRKTLPTDYALVAISTFSAQIFEAYAVADQFMAHGIPVVMGGLHVTSLPEEALAHCSSVVVGEGEPLWPELLRDFEDGSLKRVYRADAGHEFDLSDAPMPRFDLLDPDRYNRITVQTSRGCPHRCSFCASSILLTPAYKRKPVEKVIAEIHAIKDIWSRPFIEFADDNSFVNRREAKALMRALAGEHLRWFTEADISIADDPALLQLMRKAGCQQVLIGLESPSATSLDGVELKANWKQKRSEHYADAIRRIQDAGITVNGCFILGLDQDTPDTFEQVLRFVRRSGLYEIQITYLTPFPGTPLYSRLRDEGRLIREGAWDHCTLFDINFHPKRMSIDELQQGFLWLAGELYAEEETARRRAQFRSRLRQVRRAAA